jgi:hypothetical protein
MAIRSTEWRLPAGWGKAIEASLLPRNARLYLIRRH